MDSAGYTVADAAAMKFAERQQSTAVALLLHAPCAGADATAAEASECVALMRRLAFLDQQSDGGALELRGGLPCLSRAELDAWPDKASAENHPLNCAKLNAKPYPYFDGGALVARRPGIYAFFSSRNNNFSNRDQTGVLCIRGPGVDCPTDASSGVLQDANPMVAKKASLLSEAQLQISNCIDEASAYGASNAEGAASCIPATADAVLAGATAATQNKDNDALGDGTAQPCDVLEWDARSGRSKTTRDVNLAIILLFVGIAGTYVAYFSYNRFRAHREQKLFKKGDNWKSKKTQMTEMM